MLVSVFRCIVLYIAVILAVRIMGKRQIGELQPSELVITIMISELAALPMQDLNMPLLWGIMPMFLMVGLELLLSSLTLKSMRFRALCYGKPVLLIYQGKINQQELLRTRVSMEDIMEAMRGNGILKVEDVWTAVLETNGTVSIIPKPEAAPPTSRDLNIQVSETGGIPMILVMNGFILQKNLLERSISEIQLNEILNGYQIELEQVFMLTIDDSGKTFLVKQEIR
ncbi:MAG: DUF421 domain-containing protein [Clostridia bacterium]|nr:DUF421 domain-containing protein [Clostridia bacterium]